MTEAEAANREQDFILSNLSPSSAQKRLALGIVLFLVIAFVVIAGPLSTVQLPRINAFIPIYATAMFVNDTITAVLLLAQFSILRSRALLVISGGYLFNALIIVPWTLTFPGVFASSGLLGAGLQSTAWIYIVWHAGFAAFVITYALVKDGSTKRSLRSSVRKLLLSSIAIVAGTVCATTVLVAADNELLPRLMLDTLHLAPGWFCAAGFASTLNLLAIAVLWVRRRSVLDLWLMVVMFAVVTEIALISFPVPARYSLGWYSGRSCGFLSASILLFVLLLEITTLYARLLHAVLGQRRERVARLMTGDAVSASVAHEVPLSSIMIRAQTGLSWLDRSTPDVDEAKDAFKQIALAGNRAAAVIDSIRAVFKSDVQTRCPLDINELIQETLALIGSELQGNRISVQAALDEGLPQASGDRVQLQQVLLNLITNAIDSMSATEGTRTLSVKSALDDKERLIVYVEDTGTGIELEHMDRIFNPLFTTKKMAWEWDCRFAARSSRPMEDSCGWSPIHPKAQAFGLLFLLSSKRPLFRSQGSLRQPIFWSTEAGMSLLPCSSHKCGLGCSYQLLRSQLLPLKRRRLLRPGGCHRE